MNYGFNITNKGEVLLNEFSKTELTTNNTFTTVGAEGLKNTLDIYDTISLRVNNKVRTYKTVNGFLKALKSI